MDLCWSQTNTLCMGNLGVSIPINEQEEPTVSYRWTSWVWEITSWTTGKSLIILEDFIG